MVDAENADVWAVLVSSSRYWHNYRHSANAFAVYRELRELGVADDHIVLMDAGRVIDEPRNALRGEIYISDGRRDDTTLPATGGWDGESSVLSALQAVDIDYQGEEVNSHTLAYALTGQSSHDMYHSPRIHSHRNSSVIVYLAGHGGDGFFKFHDYDELDANVLLTIFQEMNRLQLYHNLLVILDTCQAETMFTDFAEQIPRAHFIASSLVGENSYAFHHNEHLGIAVVDRFTYLLVDLLREYRLQQRQQRADWTMGQFFAQLQRPQFLMSTPRLLSSASVQIPISTFFRPPVPAFHIFKGAVNETVREMMTAEELAVKAIGIQTLRGSDSEGIVEEDYLTLWRLLESVVPANRSLNGSNATAPMSPQVSVAAGASPQRNAQFSANALMLVLTIAVLIAMTR